MTKKLFFLTAFFAAYSTWDIHAAAAAAAAASAEQSRAELSKLSGLLRQELIKMLQEGTFQKDSENVTRALGTIYTEMREDYKRFQQINSTLQQKLTWADFIEEQTNAGKALELLIQKKFITTPAQLTLALNALYYEVSAGEIVLNVPKRFQTIVEKELNPLTNLFIKLHKTEPTSELNQQTTTILWFIHTGIRKSNYIVQYKLLELLQSLIYENIIQKIDIPEILNDLKKCIRHIPNKNLKIDTAGNAIHNYAPKSAISILDNLISHELIDQKQVDAVFDLLNIYMNHNNYDYSINRCLQSLICNNLIEPRHVHTILNFTNQEIKNQSGIVSSQIIPLLEDLIEQNLIRTDMLHPEQIRTILDGTKNSIDSFFSQDYSLENYLKLFKTFIEKRFIQIEDPHIQIILKNIITQMNSDEFKSMIESVKNEELFISDDIDNIIKLKAYLEKKLQEIQAGTAAVAPTTVVPEEIRMHPAAAPEPKK